MICLAMREGASGCGNLRVKQGKMNNQWGSLMIMWDVEDGGGSACYAIGRRAVIAYELTGSGLNREPE